MTYLALLRGINVGGNGTVAMAALRSALENAGLHNVRTYIQSGNVFLDTADTDKLKIARLIETCVHEHFGVNAKTVVFTKAEWQNIIAAAPSLWGKDSAWKHNVLVAIPPYDMNEIAAAVGELKPDLETMEPGAGVLYQSMSRQLLGRTTTSKLANSPLYQQLTIRNYNTAAKLLSLF